MDRSGIALVPVLAAIVVAMAVVFGIVLLLQGPPPSSQIVCTMEVKQCPDGSYVGRSGPNCEFAPCP